MNKPNLSTETTENECEMSKQEEYWHLNGGLDMLTACMELIQSGAVTSLEDMKSQISKGMKGLRKEIAEFQCEIPELRVLEAV